MGKIIYHFRFLKGGFGDAMFVQPVYAGSEAQEISANSIKGLVDALQALQAWVQAS